MNRTFEQQTYIRNEVVDGEEGWHWIKNEDGAWTGPKNDWEGSHKEYYFKRLQKRRVCIMAGGNQGMYARLYSKMFESVYAFEPDPLNFHVMVMNNQTDNVIKINAAVGAHNTFIALNRPSMTNTGMHNVNDQVHGMIPCMKIDNFNFPVVDFMQFDVEGYEYGVIKGAEETIARCRPVVVLERGQTAQIYEFMHHRGYKIDAASVSDTVWIPAEIL